MADLNKISGLAQQILDEAGAPIITPPPSDVRVDVKDQKELLTAIADGETDIALLGGGFTSVILDGVKPTSKVTISPKEGYAEKLKTLSIRRSQNIALAGFSVLPDIGGKIADVGKDAPQCDLLGIMGFAEPSLVNSPKEYLNWTKEKWLSVNVGGISSGSEGGIIEDCTAIAAYMSMTHTGLGGIMRRLSVLGFPGDAYRGLADDLFCEDLWYEDAFQINGNHSDIFQSWSIGADGKPGSGVRKNVTVSRLKGKQWTGDPKALTSGMGGVRAEPQGLGLFDGMFEGWLIEGCAIDVGAYHGISLYGATKCVIRDNNIFDSRRPGDLKRPWIMIHDHKRGIQSTDNVIENNQCGAITIDDPSARISGNVAKNSATKG